jgi:hypothetical protein
MNTDNIILRELINSPLTTKGDFLTNEDFDNNNINIYNDLVALCNTSGVIAFDEFETYDDSVLNYSTYSGRLYEYVNASPSIGVTPSTDTSYWIEVFPSILAHKRNADTVLNEGGINEVTAAEIRAFIDAGLTTTTNLAITTKTANTFLLTSSTGADVTIPAATRSEAGLMIATDKSKIDQVSGINTGDQSLISLGAEATANKATVFTTLNDVLFPTVQAVETRIVAKIDALINAAPSALDTLNELAAALGDDANFATTTTSALATKEATANKQNALTVDGTGVKFPTVDAVNSALALIPSGITIGTTAITSGTTKRVLFQDGSVVSQSANFVFDASTQLVIGGHTGGAKLDVKCGGALSTDLGLRVRNSADTGNLFVVNGNHDVFSNGKGNVSTNFQYGLGNFSGSTTGANNIAFGSQNLPSLTSGVNNIAIGTQSLFSLSTASNNTSIGHQSLAYSNAVGNTGVGYRSLFLASSGSENTSVGNLSLTTVTTGANNTGFGSESLTNATGSNNTSVGRQSSYSIGSGSGNIGVGYLSLYGVTTGSNNIQVGINSGVIGITTGSYNTLIGGGFSGLSTSLANNVIITDGQANQLIRKDANHNQILGAETVLSTTATNGFTYFPTCAGLPTGTPTTVTGKAPIVIDSTNNKMYIYSGGAWVALN